MAPRNSTHGYTKSSLEKVGPNHKGRKYAMDGEHTHKFLRNFRSASSRNRRPKKILLIFFFQRIGKRIAQDFISF
jgi:hypothetical protein